MIRGSNSGKMILALLKKVVILYIGPIAIDVRRFGLKKLVFDDFF